MPRLKPLRRALGAIQKRLRPSSALRVACDYDGTLTPIVSHPARARLASRTRRVLRSLAAARGVRLAILSGRRLDDLREQVGLGGIYLSGCSGLETLTADGRRALHVPEVRALPAELRDSMGAWCERTRGAWLEDKDLTFAIHYRAVPARAQGAFRAGVLRRFAPMRRRARLIRGKKVFEFLPAVSWDKAAALRHWLAGRGAKAQRGTKALLFYFGDDANDEPVHRLVARRGGVAVAVGGAMRYADYLLPRPTDVVWFLEWLAREWAGHASARGRPPHVGR